MIRQSRALCKLMLATVPLFHLLEHLGTDCEQLFLLLLNVFAIGYNITQRYFLLLVTTVTGSFHHSFVYFFLFAP